MDGSLSYDSSQITVCAGTLGILYHVPKLATPLAPVTLNSIHHWWILF